MCGRERLVWQFCNCKGFTFVQKLNVRKRKSCVAVLQLQRIFTSDFKKIFYSSHINHDGQFSHHNFWQEPLQMTFMHNFFVGQCGNIVTVSAFKLKGSWREMKHYCYTVWKSNGQPASFVCSAAKQKHNNKKLCILVKLHSLTSTFLESHTD